MFKQHQDFAKVVVNDFLGGPKIIKQCHIINAQKGLTAVFVVFLIWWYQNFSLGAYLYLGLHGSYGVIWVVKDFTFPDRTFQNKITIGSLIFTVSLLGLYWVIAWLQISEGIQNPSNGRVVTAIFAYVFGVVLMIVSDCQKYYTLKYKQGLITEGMFKYNRNPNYTGEMLLYSSFAILSGNWLAYAILFTVWIVGFYGFMINKDISFSKKQGWNEYKKQSYLFLWKVHSNDIINYALYGALVAYLIWDYQVSGAITLLKK
ncbi:unnamed protein product [Paramecium sonneborni]|uniref:Steroid 5-alpha reductase C-terminal domain-containing protein n=1 Tax=Paramecium sonneborni TaxID=65129 RepID=A0A8S1R090_9CILI|nr:unnamed protein product [Paramecium sonneborni]